jgi:DNA polymerase I
MTRLAWRSRFARSYDRFVAKKPKPELFLIDGNSLAYRAFFALPESIATSDGRPTNAIFGFASMLVKIVTEHNPAAVVVAWDAGMSGREKEYEDYKAGRRPRPDLLAEQWPHMMPLVEAFGYENVKVEGYEADDVIASLVRRAREQKIPVMVVSGDRDVYQVVEDGVRVMTTSRGITDTKVYDREGVMERYGVPPELVTDLIGLKGDTSDNIPGVPGIGDKTAAQLLQEFGSLDGVLENVDKISGAKRKQNLSEHADDARVSKQLATLQFDIETGLDLDELIASEPDRSALRDFMREFELRAILERLEEGLPEGELVPGRKVEREVEAEAVEGGPEDLAEGPVALAIDAGHWAAADADRLVTGSYEGMEQFAKQIAAHPLIAHDAKSLGGGRHGLLAGAAEARLDLRLEHDTMLGAYLIDPARRNYDLVELAADAGIGLSERNGVAPVGSDSAATGDGASSQLELGEEAEARLDPPDEARLVAELAAVQRPRLAEWGLEDLLRDVELPLVEVLAAMEREGIKLDAKRLEEIGEGFADEIAKLESEIYGLADGEFTIGSPQQVAEVLFDKLELTRKRRGKTGFSTDARVLAQIRDEHEIVPKIESWRELTKLKSTYLDTLPDLIDPDTRRIHTTFNQAVTTTGRLSSTNPNLQNIPIRTELGRPLRSCFVAEPALRRLQPGRAAGPRPRRRRASAEGDLRGRGRRPRGDRGGGLQHPPRRGRRRPAVEGEDGQLRDRLRADRVRARRPAGDPAGRGRGVRRPLPGALPRRAGVSRRDDRARPGGRLRDDADGPEASDPGAALRSGADPPARRTARGQHRYPGNRRRHHQGGDGSLPRRLARWRAQNPADPPDPRRAALRGPLGRDGEGGGAGAQGDVPGIRSRPPAGGRPRRRQGLAGRQVAASRGRPRQRAVCRSAAARRDSLSEASPVYRVPSRS